MDTSLIWFLVWLTGYIVNVILYIAEGIPVSQVSNKYFKVSLLCRLSWGLVILWFFTKINSPEEDGDY